MPMISQSHSIVLLESDNTNGAALLQSDLNGFVDLCNSNNLFLSLNRVSEIRDLDVGL